MSALHIILIIFTALFAAATAFLAVFVLTKQVKRRLARSFLCAAAALIATLALVFSVYYYQISPALVKEKTRIIMFIATPSILAIAVLLVGAKALGTDSNSPINGAKGHIFSTLNLVRMAIFTALSVVLYMVVKFPLPFIFPEFLDIQISDMPALLAAFTMGAGPGAIVIILKTLIKLPFTTTGGVGELGDLLLGLVYVLSAAAVYHKKRTKTGAIIALAVSSAMTVLAAIIINRFILIPFYTMFMLPWNVLLGMVSKLYPSVTKDSFYTYYLSFAVLPFNLLRCLITSLVTFFLYKPVRRIFKQRRGVK